MCVAYNLCLLYCLSMLFSFLLGLYLLIYLAYCVMFAAISVLMFASKSEICKATLREMLQYYDSTNKLMKISPITRYILHYNDATDVIHAYCLHRAVLLNYIDMYEVVCIPMITARGFCNDRWLAYSHLFGCMRFKANCLLPKQSHILHDE